MCYMLYVIYHIIFYIIQYILHLYLYEFKYYYISLKKFKITPNQITKRNVMCKKDSIPEGWKMIKDPASWN